MIIIRDNDDDCYYYINNSVVVHGGCGGMMMSSWEDPREDAHNIHTIQVDIIHYAGMICKVIRYWDIYIQQS